MSFEGVCGTFFGGRFWSSERGALGLEGVFGLLFDRRFVTASETCFEPTIDGEVSFAGGGWREEV